MSARKIVESNHRVSSGASSDRPNIGADESNILRQLSLPIVQATTCIVCGAPFEIRRRRGRPQAFCDDVCRATQLKTQKSDWSQKNWARKRAARSQPTRS